VFGHMISVSYVKGWTVLDGQFLHLRETFLSSACINMHTNIPCTFSCKTSVAYITNTIDFETTIGTGSFCMRISFRTLVTHLCCVGGHHIFSAASKRNDCLKCYALVLCVCFCAFFNTHTLNLNMHLGMETHTQGLLWCTTTAFIVLL